MKTIHEVISGIVNAASLDNYAEAVKILTEFVDEQKINPIQSESMNGQVIKLLGQAWNSYLISCDHQSTPQDTDNLNDFRKSIHDAQRIVSTRELQLLKPDFFK